MGVFLLCLLKTKTQVVFFVLIIRHKAGRYIDDDPFIGHGTIHLNPMQVVFFHQNDIVGLQLISFSFYIILYISADKDGNLMELVIVELILLHQLVGQMKDAEITVQISFFFIISHSFSFIMFLYVSLHMLVSLYSSICNV